MPPTATVLTVGLLFFVSVKPVWGLVKDAASAWVDDSAPRLGAALSFYTVFAISPLLIIVIFVASLWFDQAAVRDALFGQLADLVGKRGAASVQSMLHAAAPHHQGVVASIMAIGTLILTSTGLFIELQGSLNAIWGVERKPGHGLWGFIKDRLLSFAMVVGIGFLLLVSLIVSAALSAIGKYVAALVPGLDVVWLVINGTISFAVIAVLFAMIFKVLPDVKIAWRDVWVGAVITALLFTAGKFALGFYLGRNTTVSAYGAAGSLVLVLLWVYYSAQILFFGAELTQVYANQYGAHLEPKRYAQWKSPELRLAGTVPKGPETAPKPERKEELLAELREQVKALEEARRMAIQARAGSRA